jgi:hypothetical protein
MHSPGVSRRGIERAHVFSSLKPEKQNASGDLAVGVGTWIAAGGGHG